MDDDDLPRRRDDVLDALAMQPLDPLSLDELDARMALLAAEIERTRAHRLAAAAVKVNAQALFKGG